MYRQRAIDCTIDKLFIYNEHFKCAKRNLVWLWSGKLPFTLKGKSSVRGDHYKTFFGPSVFHTGVVYADSSTNLEKALTRLTCARVIDGISVEEEFQYAQRDRFSSSPRPFLVLLNRTLGILRSRCRRAYTVSLEHHDARENYISKPHPKRKVRIYNYKELLESGLLDYGKWMDTVMGKVKCPEFAKLRKYPRMVNDLTTKGSLLGGELARVLKKLFSEDISIGVMRARFIATPDVNALKGVFERLISPSFNEFVYYSDDACAAFLCRDGVFRCNMDISQCDASNGPAIFDLLQEIVSDCPEWSDLMRRVIDQCKSDLIMSNPGVKHGKGFRISPLQPIEYSGTVLTTLLNNMANLVIFLSIYSDVMALKPLRSDMQDIIIRCARRVGYIVTVSVCDNIQSLQFLKFSPFFDACGNVVPQMNLGVVLRALGQKDGDLLGRGSIHSRAFHHNAGVVASCSQGGNNVIISTLKEKYNVSAATRKVSVGYLTDHLIGESTAFVSDEQLVLRYGFSLGELSHAARLLKDAHFGDKIFCEALNRIMDIDYSLGR